MTFRCALAACGVACSNLNSIEIKGSEAIAPSAMRSLVFQKFASRHTKETRVVDRSDKATSRRLPKNGTQAMTQKGNEELGCLGCNCSREGENEVNAS
jgi:hypothetical protein